MYFFFTTVHIEFAAAVKFFLQQRKVTLQGSKYSEKALTLTCFR